jgi:hypothetical protein
MPEIALNPPLSTHTGRRGRLGVLLPETGDGTQGLAKKPAAGSGDALGARASGAHPARCLQPEKERQKRGRPAMTTTPLRRPFAPHPPTPFSHTGRRGRLGVLLPETGDGTQGLAKKPAAGSGDALGARASGAHPARCLQPEKERQKRGRPAMTTTPLRRPFAPHPPNPLLPHGEKGASGHLEAQNERRNARASRKPAPVSACEGIAGGL